MIDVGIDRAPDGRLVGDVDFDGVQENAGYITPVPGGVGPIDDRDARRQHGACGGAAGGRSAETRGRVSNLAEGVPYLEIVEVAKEQVPNEADVRRELAWGVLPAELAQRAELLTY